MAHRRASLRRKEIAEKKVAITVFSFPPDKGNVGTAAYLNVFGSILECLKSMKASGYQVGELPVRFYEKTVPAIYASAR